MLTRPQLNVIFSEHVGPDLLPPDRVAVVFPSTNAAFRAELELIGGEREQDRRGRGESWTFRREDLMRVLEAAEDFYPSWEFEPQCARCGVVAPDVTLRRSFAGGTWTVCRACAWR